ncbi:xanthine dehydrogenase family protein molybdopterin-binding subunit [Pseudonocardia bannensis]|uniref:Xanthine dehydrogenase family protein molybdopterin-binding subunit n=1 Tax=Pseudonocardia bannensis TaxID=630973 RepID=A0A848DIW6_9PSEU|nr:xanthine dehydrogenase family protein molybdopterin-binding subunit [Pseudonocardia bannensis]
MLDARDRVTGRTPFVINHEVPGMLHCRLVRSTAAHAEITAVRTGDAAAWPGAVAVVTGADLAARGDMAVLFGPVLLDQPVLAIDVVRYIGEPVAAVLAEDPAVADEAAALVEVDYAHLPAVFDAEEAFGSDTARLFPEPPERDPSFVDVTLRADHERNVCNTFTVVKGDVEAGFAAADLVFDDVFDSPAAGAVPLETHAVVADARGDRLTVWSSTQTPYITRRQLALLLGLPLNRVRVIVPALGGGFGAKAYASVEPIAAALSRVVGAPVRLHLTREEEFVTSTKHAMRVRIRTGVMRDGRIVAREATAYYNAGAYAVISPRKVMFGAYGLNGPYAIPHVRTEAHAVLTNTPPAGAYRGFAINQCAWAYEGQLDMIAERLGIDPVEIRRINLLRDGDTFCTGETLDHLRFHDLLDAAAERIGWDPDEPVHRDGDLVRAKGISCVIEGTITPSTSTATVRLGPDGSVDVLTSSVEMGQGIRPALAAGVARHLGIDPALVGVSYVDTDLTPYDQQTTASRSMYSMGGAMGRAADDALHKIRELAADLLEVDPADLEIVDGQVRVAGVEQQSLSLGEVVRRSQVGNVIGEGTLVTSGGLDPFTGQGVGSVHWHQSVGAAEIEVDTATGHVRVLRYTGGVFAGEVVDPVGAEHQCEGCLVFGVGNALMEELVFDQGQLVTGTLADYMVPTLEDMPRHHEFELMEDPEHGEVHGLGEPALPPIAPAISNALYRATGVRIRSLPISAEKVLRGLRERRESEQAAGQVDEVTSVGAQG